MRGQCRARIFSGQCKDLGACRTWGVDSEKRPQRGQFLPDLQAHSPAMGQKAGEKWTAEAVSQPTIPKSDRLLGLADDPLVERLVTMNVQTFILGGGCFCCLKARRHHTQPPGQRWGFDTAAASAPTARRRKR